MCIKGSSWEKGPVGRGKKTRERGWVKKKSKTVSKKKWRLKRHLNIEI
jgi:hypothetical protein